MMEQDPEAVYSEGVLKRLEKLDLAENQRVHIVLSVPDIQDVEQALQAWHEVYGGLPADEVAAIEKVILDRRHFVNRQL